MNHPVVRMILSDVDGTLIKKGKNSVPEDVFSAIRLAEKNDIRFVIASGRSYFDLRTLFAPVSDSVCIIADDGALAVQNNKILYSSAIPKKNAEELLSVARSAGADTAVLYGKNIAYTIGAASDDIGFQKIFDISGMQDDIYKVAFFGATEFAKYKIRSYAKYSGKFTEIYADKTWLEFVSVGTDKGTVCKFLQSAWNISSDETAAFGDNTNDFGMLRCAQLTFSAPAAIPEIVSMCKYRTDNVLKEIIKLTQERGTL